MVEKKQNALHAYLRFVMDATNLSASKLAKKANIASSTITRFLNDPYYKFVPSSVTIEKIASATGINPGPFFRAEHYGELGLTPYASPDLYDESKWGVGSNAPEDRNDDPNDCIIIIGEAKAGNWKEPRIAGFVPGGVLALRFMDYHSYDMFALIYKGENLNKVANDGDVLVCVNTKAFKWRIMEGDVWIIERTMENFHLIEVSARIMRTIEGRAVLTHASGDSQYQEVLETDEASQKLDYRVIGKVAFVYKDINRACREFLLSSD